MDIDIYSQRRWRFLSSTSLFTSSRKMFLRDESCFVVAALRSGAWPRRRSGRLGGTPQRCHNESRSSRPRQWPVFSCPSWFVRPLRRIGLAAFDFPYRSAGEINAVGIMHQAVENAIGQRWIADLGVPFGDRHLAGKDRGSQVITLFTYLQEIAAFLVGQRGHGEVIDDQHVDLSEPVQQRAKAAIGTRHLQAAE